MFLSSVTIAGGALLVGVKVYRDEQKKKAMPWTYYAEKMNKKRGITTRSDRQTLFSSLITTKNALIKRVEGQTASLLAPSLRHQQLQKVSSVDASISEVEQVANRNLKLALGSLAITTTGALIYSPLSLASVPLLLYLHMPDFKESFNVILKEKRVNLAVVDATLTLGLLLSGQYLACALTSSFLMLSNKLLVKVEDHSLNSLVNLFGKQPRFVWLLSDGVEIEIPFDDLQVDNIIVVHAGEMIPADGTIIDGIASVDQRMLTGEGQPAEKGVGDQALASTVILSGRIHIKVESAGSDTVAAQITNILNRTTDFKKHIEWQWVEWIDKTALLTLLSSAISWPILGPSGALAVLYSINFGHSMRIIAPLTMLNFLNLTSQNSVLIKDGRALESLKQVDTIVFDKTGTLTQEQPTLSQIHTLNGYSQEQLLTYAAAAEYKQTHPIALAILKEARQRGLTLPEIEDAKYEIGYGLKVRIDDEVIRVGSMRFMTMEKIAIPTEIRQIQNRSHELGHSMVCVAINEEIGGAIELVPTIRKEAKQIVDSLRSRGMSMVIISGDHEKPTRKLAQELGIEHYFAETLPENKATLIRQLQEEGKKVCFVGDGINDSIALKQADLSISLSGATSVAMDTAQIVLMDGSLKQLDNLFDISRDFDENMQTSFTMTTIPTILSLGGIFLLHIGIITTIFFYYGGLAIGVGNSMRPLLKQQKEQTVHSEQ